MFEQIPDIYVDGGKCKQTLPVNVSNINDSIVKEEKGKDKEIQLSLSTKELIDAQSSDTFCPNILMLIDHKKVS